MFDMRKIRAGLSWLVVSLMFYVITAEPQTRINRFTQLGGVGSTNTSANAMASAATDTQLAELPIPSAAINTAGRVVRIEASGIWGTGTTQTPTWTFKLKLCTVSGCGSGTALTIASWTSAAATASTTETWILHANLGTVTTGGTGTVIAHGFADLPVGATANTAWAGIHDVNTLTQTISLTGNLFLDLVAQVSTQSGTKNSCTYHMFSAEPNN